MKLCLASASVIVLSQIAVAQAQTAPAQTEAVDTIIVTATKRETSLLDADVSATVLQAEALHQARVTDIRRIDDLAPNVQFNDSSPLGAVYISIRGVESNPFIVNRAAVYIDGIPYRELSNSVLTQLQSVEVLRGPQSTLYGANTESGLIVINTRAPSDEPMANIGLTVGHYDTGETYEIEGYAGGPLVENTLSGSLAFQYSDRDYFLKNIGATPQGQGHIRETFIQGRLRWTPTDRLTINANGYITNTDAPGIYRFDGFPVEVDRYNAVYRDGAAFDPSNPFSPPPVNGGLSASDFEFIHDAPKRADIHEHVAGVSMTYAMDQGDVDFALSYRNEDIDDYGFDIDNSNAPILAGAALDTTELFNGELRFTSNDNQPLIYSFGVSFYADEETQILGSLVGPGTLNDFNFAPEQAVRSRDVGLFASASYTPQFIPKLTATVGLRYDHAYRETTQQEGILDLGFNQFVYDNLNLDGTFDAILPRIALRHETRDNLTFYANIAKGYLPGGFNLAAAQDGFQDDVIQYDSEELWSYEAGAKWRSASGNAFVSGAVFFIEADNYQEIRVLIDDQGNVVSTSFIGSDAGIESYGFEIEGQWKPVDGLNLTGNFGIVEAEYTAFSSANPENIIGNPVKLIPSYDANLAARYAFASGWFVRGEINFIGETALDEGDRSDFTVNAVDTQDAVEIYGLQLGYETDRWSARLFVENVTDVRRMSGGAYPNAAFPTDGQLYGAVDSPRVIGLELGYEF